MKHSFGRLAALVLLAVWAVALIGQAQAQSVKMQALIRDLKEEIPKREKEINEGCGHTVTLEIDFASFGDKFESLEHVSYQGLEQTTYGLRRFCANSDRPQEKDPVKVGALKKVKKVVLKWVEKSEQKKITVKNGVVLIEEAFGESGGWFDAPQIAAQLNDKL